jgi:hypothetical protein
MSSALRESFREQKDHHLLDSGGRQQRRVPLQGDWQHSGLLGHVQAWIQ